MSTARDIERAMLERCLQIATTPDDAPRDQAEANVCRLAGMIVDGRYPEAGARLFDAATRYFADHPEQQVASAEVVRRGWIISAPRLRYLIEKALPFEPLIPNETTIAAMREARTGNLKSFDSVGALMADLHAED